MQPDPSFLAGGVPETPFVLQHAPQPLFATRAARLRFLAQSSELAPYLHFLADLCTLQATLAGQLPAPAPVTARRLDEALAAGLPPIDRGALVDDAQLLATLHAVCEQARALDMPESARQALDAVRGAEPPMQRGMLAEVLADQVPADGVATHLFVALAVQLHLGRLAAALPAGRLQPVATGTCPACGGRPVSSSVIGLRDIDNVRYACCAGCATQWNEVRIKCLCCGATSGISYRSAGTEDATVKAETCRACGSWLKTLYQVRNASLEPVADDVGSLGLDLLMRDTPFRRAGFNPFLLGY
ncbi:MAG: formate dehydrogenase accessory protein FdhE [Roseateles sp.]|uniref:formate dehydrogenase accessory protein FdhE n=1 Tax=Roseateles sp. TaxID=1971397 RepID=UPI0039E8DA4B